jgi:hypothetical protein
VIPSLDIVAVRAGNRSWHPNPEEWTADYAVLRDFITPIVKSTQP